MNFPKKENDIVSLATTMAYGLSQYSEDLAGVDPTALNAALSSYNTSKNNADNAKSTCTVAVATKQDALDQLVSAMKNVIKQTEVVCADDPSKLSEIGWGPKAAPVAITPPGQPTDLTCSPQGDTTAGLQWKKASQGQLLYPAKKADRPIGSSGKLADAGFLLR